MIPSPDSPAYVGLSNEPRMAAPGQGKLTEQDKFFYDVRVSDLGKPSTLTRSFRAPEH